MKKLQALLVGRKSYIVGFVGLVLAGLTFSGVITVDQVTAQSQAIAELIGVISGAIMTFRAMFAKKNGI